MEPTMFHAAKKSMADTLLAQSTTTENAEKKVQAKVCPSDIGGNVVGLPNQDVDYLRRPSAMLAGANE